MPDDQFSSSPATPENSANSEVAPPLTNTATRSGPSRRTVLVAAGAAAVATTAAACSSDDSGSSGDNGSTEAPGTTAAEGGAGGDVLTPTADVPVGGGVIVGDVVVTQASAGQFAGFSTRCPHRGCPVSKIENRLIDCTCHGSKFNLDGSVQNGPATSPLEPIQVTVRGSDVVRA